MTQNPKRVMRGGPAPPSAALTGGATLSNCGEVLKLRLPLPGRKARGLTVTTPRDVTMDDPQPSPKGGHA
jgi:hypothetical protein